MTGIFNEDGPVILAYADRDSVRPGERVEFKVSCTGADTYRADIVKLKSLHAAATPPSFASDALAVIDGWTLPAREQRIEAGSYGLVERWPEPGASFTLGVIIFPTLPGKGGQTILGNLSDSGGFRLFIDETGRASFTVKTGRGIESLQIDTPLTARRWYSLCACVDHESGELQLSQHRLPSLLLPHEAPASARRACAERALPSSVPLGFGASLASRSGHERTMHFNGKIERPWIARGAAAFAQAAERTTLDAAQIASKPDTIACWDFSLRQDTDDLVDVGPHGSRGRIYNLPTRGCTGSSWTGKDWNWRSVPSEYAAIHFHDDDLEDCGWATDFTFTVPPDLPGGIYAARLTADSGCFFVPFFVRPRAGRRTADTVLLISTATFLAYANYTCRLFDGPSDIGHGSTPIVDAADLVWLTHPEVGLSCYDLHGDGSRVVFSSRRRPILNLRPDEPDLKMAWNVLAVDLLITDWLEHIGVPYDVLTDEDLHREGARALEGYRVVLTGAHPEYCSREEIDALASFSGDGGRLMYLGGNGFFWRVAFHPERAGVIELRRGDISHVRQYKERGQFYHTLDDGQGGLWRDLGIPAQTLVGVGTIATGFDESRPYWLNPDAKNDRVKFMFEGVDANVIGADGIMAEGAAGLEIDCIDYAQGTPLHALIVASSKGHSNVYYASALMIEDTLQWGAAGQGALDDIRADMVFFETGSGGAVFSTGSIAYAGALSPNQYRNPIARLTENVLRRFIDGTPFEMPKVIDRDKTVIPQW
jgi:N,N-dimethylformamidase